MITKMLFAIGIILIAAVIAFFGFNDVVSVMASARMDLLLLAVFIQLISLPLFAMRLMFISGKHGSIGFLDALKITMSGMAISMITPIAKIGGEPLKIYLLKKKRFSGSEATAIIAVDTVAELVSSLLMVMLIFLIFAEEVPGIIFSSFIVFLAVVAAIIAIIVKLLMNPAWMRKIIRWVSRNISRYAHVKKRDYARLFHEAFEKIITDRSVVLPAFGISFITKLLEFARMWLVFAAISIFLPWDVIVIVWAVILVLYLVPWLPGSLGLVEFFGASMLIFFGLASSAAAGGLLIDRFISFWLVMILGLLILSTMPLPKRLKK